MGTVLGSCGGKLVDLGAGDMAEESGVALVGDHHAHSRWLWFRRSSGFLLLGFATGLGLKLAELAGNLRAALGGFLIGWRRGLAGCAGQGGNIDGNGRGG